MFSFTPDAISVLVAIVGYAVCLYVLHLYSVQGQSTSPGSFLFTTEFSYRELILISVLSLFLEMMMIRWISAEIQIFAYFKNFVLIACFLGFGLGCARCRQTVHPIATVLGVLFFAVLLSTPLKDQMTELSRLIGSTSQIQIWNFGANPAKMSTLTSLALAGFCFGPLFGIVVFLFVPLGQYVGWMLERAPRGVMGYTLNVSGSLAGVLLYTFLCFLWQPPAIWFLISALIALLLWLGKTQRMALLCGVFLTSAVLTFTSGLSLDPTGIDKVFWSPYQKLELTRVFRHDGDLYGLSLTTNGAWHQIILKFSKSQPDLKGTRDWHPYNLPYRFRPSPDSVLVLGSGMGNDVAAALRNTHAEVTAVEIDPVILKLGKDFHFERPYASERVHIINDDARSYIQNSGQKFDLVLFSLLDSHTTASSYSNVRIDNYVYTVEAMKRSREILKPDGLMVVKFLAAEPWIADRLRGVLQESFQHNVLELVDDSNSTGVGGRFFFAGSPESLQAIVNNPELSKHVRWADKGTVDLTTDDWPYFYQRSRGMPLAVLAMSGFVLLFSFAVVSRVVLRQSKADGRWRAHFFFLGAGFMLIEAQIVSKMALLFGTTWVVNSIVVSGLLVLIVFANFAYQLLPRVPIWLPYAGLFGSLALGYLIPLQSLFLPQVWLRIAVATAVLCIPVFFAGMVFIRSFGETEFSGDSLGWNLLGAVLGGMLETTSQATGMHALLIWAAFLYAGSWIARYWAKVDGKVPRVAAAEA